MGDDYQTTKEMKHIFRRDITEWSFWESHCHYKQTGELCLFETPPVHEQVTTEPATSSNKDVVSSVQQKPVTQSVVTGKDPLHTLAQVPMQVEEPPTPLHEGISVMQRRPKMEAPKEPPVPLHEGVSVMQKRLKVEATKEPAMPLHEGVPLVMQQ